MLAAAVVMVAVEMNGAITQVAVVAVMIPVVDADILLDHGGRSPISRDPNAVGRVIAVDPGIARSRTRGARNHDGRGSAESDADADARGREEAASQEHHHCDRPFHFLALLGRMNRTRLA